MAVITTFNGFAVLVDDEDVERLSKRKWIAFESKPGSGYWRVRNYREGRLVYIHHDVLNVDSRELKRLELVVDHINRNPLDNRKENLRIVTQLENMANSKFAGTGDGICYNKTAKLWFAYVNVLGGKRKYVPKYYKTREEAVAARERFINGSNS